MSAAIHRPPPAHPGPNPESQPSYSNRVPNSGVHDPGLQGPQELGPHVSSRPFMCVPVPPPPPFLHYQWPMPFSYNPFSGFPGMGYGMVMPPFPPPLPYMESPAYVMPHPQFQPVDYRRLLHPAVPVPSAPHQHPNQPRRVRPPHTAPVRETTNSEVQTEPTQRGPGGPGEFGPLISSDSGHGTMSNSPSSSRSSSRSSSSSHRQGQAGAETFPKDSQVNQSRSATTVTQGFSIHHPSETRPVQSSTRKNSLSPKVLEMVPPCRDAQCNMWPVDSPDNVVLIRSSSQKEDEAVKERRVSIPDILMSWVGTSPQEVMLQKSVALQKKDQLLSQDAEVEKEKSEHQSPAEDSPVVAEEAADDDDDDDEGTLSLKDTETLFKILKLPLILQDLLSESIRDNEPSASVEQPSRDDLLQSFNQSQRLHHNEQDSETTSHTDTSEIPAYHISVDSFQMARKLNESIWSVESLAPFFPNKSLLQSSIFEPKAIAEVTERDENNELVMLHDNSVVKPSKERRRSLRFSSSDSLLMPDNLMIFSTPAVEQSRSQKQTKNESKVCEKNSPKGQSTTSSENVLASPPQLQRQIILSPPTREEADEPRSSEPEAPQSPNQETFTLPEQKEKSPRSSEQEETLLNSAEEESMSPPYQLIHTDGEDRKSDDGAGENCEVRDTQLSVPVAHQTMAVSPSRENMVDFGVQCGVMDEQQCMCEKSGYGPNKKHLFKYSDARFSNCRAEGYCANGQNPKNQKRNGPWKNRGPEKQNGPTDGYNGYPGKPGRSRGGYGRNHKS